MQLRSFRKLTTSAGMGIVATALVGTVMLGAPGAARASLTIFAQEAGVNGGAFTAIATTNADFTPISFSGTYGTFTLVINGASSNNGASLSNLLGSTNNIINTSGTTQTIGISIVQTNYSLPVGTVLNVESGLGGTLTAGTTVGLTGIFSAVYNNTNSATVFTMGNGLQTAIQTGSTFDTGSAFGTLTRPTSTSLYALASGTSLTISGGGSLNYSNHVNVTAAATVVPEPATVAMALTALPLLGLGALLRRRRRAQA